MANICTNILWISGIKDEKQMDQFKGLMNDSFECFYEDETDAFCEIGFNSKHDFPEKEMNGIVQKLDMAAVQIGVISYDFSVNYVAYHIHRNGVWEKSIHH